MGMQQTQGLLQRLQLKVAHEEKDKKTHKHISTCIFIYKLCTVFQKGEPNFRGPVISSWGHLF